MTLKEKIDELICWTNREPMLTIRRILWIVAGGWMLFLLYLFGAVVMIMFLFTIPFVPSVLRLAVFALDPIKREPYTKKKPSFDRETPYLENPLHPYSVAGNIVWLIFPGWIIALFHVMLGVFFVLTIFGIGDGLTHFKLARFALWPLGYNLRARFLPTYVGEQPPPGFGQTQEQAGQV